jgi:DNA-binding HxlR family transcriptional regulator
LLVKRFSVTIRETSEWSDWMDGRTCPVAEAAKVLGDKWTLLLLRDLAGGSRRFKDLERSVDGISPTMLAARLRELERQGLLTRMCYTEIPPRVEYHLTEKGVEALPIVEALRTYGDRWLLHQPEPSDAVLSST